MESAYFSLSNLIDKHDVKTIKHELGLMPGVKSVSVSADDEVAIDYDGSAIGRERMQMKIKKMGYEISDVHFKSTIM